MKRDHIMSHDAIYVSYLAIMITVLSFLGASMAFHG